MTASYLRVAVDCRATMFSALVCAILSFTFTASASADITGLVVLQGQPNSQDETFVAKANNCGESPIRHTENWKVGPKGELGDVVVWIVDPKCGPLNFQIAPPTVNQRGCSYIPHVVVVRVNESLRIVNADPVLHNVRAKIYYGPGKPPGADVFNFGQIPGQADDRQFDQPSIYTLQCDVHSWMQCWVMVLPKALIPAYAITGLNGTYKLSAGAVLSDGDYKIDAWHPRFAQTIEQTIHVKNGTAQANFQFDGTKSF